MGLIEVKTSLGGLEKKIAQLTSIKSSVLNDIVRDIAVQAIKDNTASHLDYHNSYFKAYTSGYKKKKLKMGLGTEPDLRVTGEMLDSLVSSKQGIITTISVGSDQQLKAQGNQKYRKFMGIGPQVRQRMVDAVRNFIYAKLRI